MDREIFLDKLAQRLAEEPNYNLFLSDYGLKDSKLGRRGLAEAAAGAFIDVLRCDLELEEELFFKGFGKFYFQILPERDVRNPQTGESMTAMPMARLCFRAAKDFREQLKERVAPDEVLEIEEPEPPAPAPRSRKKAAPARETALAAKPSVKKAVAKNARPAVKTKDAKPAAAKPTPKPAAKTTAKPSGRKK